MERRPSSRRDINSFFLPLKYSFYSLEDLDYEEDFDIIFYNPDTYRAYHFSPYTVAKLFILTGYTLVNQNEYKDNYYFKLKGYGEKIYIFTEPSQTLIRFFLEDRDEIEFKVDCYSSLIFYEESGRIRHLSLEEINELSLKQLEEYLYSLSKLILISQENPNYII
ncbi:MAG: hypothetical protein ACP5H3_03205 [Candidatus Aenigmatarchaeota archaeon]